MVVCYHDKNKDIQTKYTNLEENQKEERKQDDANTASIYIILVLCGIIGFIYYRRQKNRQRRIYNNLFCFFAVLCICE